MVAERGKRFGLLLATEDSDYVKKMFGGYFNVFVEAFGEEGQQWDLFRVVKGEFPDLARLDEYDGFVVSGSPHDAHGNQMWIRKLCFLLQRLDEMGKKIMGVCFGHQVLCRALGGKTGRAKGGWDLGLRRITITDELRCREYLNGFKIPRCISIIQCHQDEVWEIPADAEVVAYSDQTRVEMFTCGENVLGIQGHPEYSKDILFSIVDRLVSNNVIQESLGEEVKDRLEDAEADRDLLLTICKGFLSGR